MKIIGVCLAIVFAIVALSACSDDDDLKVYTISAVSNDADFGYVVGTGEYTEGETVTLEAVPNEDYQFIYWLEEGEVVHQDALYEFIATEDRNLIAIFTHASQGYFSLEVTGYFEEEWEGFAIFGEITNDETGQEVFALTLFTTDETINLVFVKGGNRPGIGTTLIGELDYEDVSEDMIFNEDHFVATLLKIIHMYFFFSDDGSITIEESTSDSFAGSFEMSASGFKFTQPMEELQIEISGSFAAIVGDVDIPFVTSTIAR